MRGKKVKALRKLQKRMQAQLDQKYEQQAADETSNAVKYSVSLRKLKKGYMTLTKAQREMVK